jgi:hypothetical protein
MESWCIHSLCVNSGKCIPPHFTPEKDLNNQRNLLCIACVVDLVEAIACAVTLLQHPMVSNDHST